MNYSDFIRSKNVAAKLDGIEPGKLPKALKPFQEAALRWALARKRSALFAGTGLGKTLKQLCWAQVVGKEEGGRILILTPLAVAQQTILEAKKFDIKGVDYSKGDKLFPITVTNYDRMDSFDAKDFCGVVLDESSIIKHENSKTRLALEEKFQHTQWKLCCTATPAPNDYVEIGNHSEFLGILDASEMLAMYFVHEGAIRAGDAEEDWRLKRHAEQEFWQWVLSWALIYRSPSDLGFQDDEYILPELRKHPIEVQVEEIRKPFSGWLVGGKMSLQERSSTRKRTAEPRVKAAADLVASDKNASWLIWCGLNNEADLLEKEIPGALQVSGSMTAALKQERLLGFVNKAPRVLITKPSIAGFGMNWQHCHKMIFVGLNDSFEQLYQAMRRCWRFGQKHPVDVYIISSSAENAVVENIIRKEGRQENMYDMAAALSKGAIRNEKAKAAPYVQFKGEFPAWLASTK